MNIYWTRTARDDLQAIWNAASLNSSVYANKFVCDLLSSAHNTLNSPEGGTIVPEINDPNTKEIICNPYRIMYQVRKDKIYFMQISSKHN